MKKTKFIKLVLITGLLASCNKHKENASWDDNNGGVNMRSDTSAPYTRTGYYGGSNAWLWYYAFRPYGYMNGGYYRHAGYYSSAISERSNIGSSSFKSSVVRGGFGSHGYSVSS